jgi:hypothetical protein
MIRIIFRKIRNLFTFKEIHYSYRIDGTTYKTFDKGYFRKETYPNFSEEFHRFKLLLNQLMINKGSATFYKFGDGDFYFLKGLPVGSAKPGNRALSLDYSQIDMDFFVNTSKKCSYYLCEIPLHNRNLFQQTFKPIEPDFPAEFIYGLVANRWLFQNARLHGLKVGLIGASEKLKIIHELFSFEAYSEYIGIESFDDYIEIPQQFACDDVFGLIESLKIKLRNSDCDIFLIGVGHVKSGILSLLTEIKSAIYVDIGSGIDALAGIVDTERPYFGKWKNYTLPDSSMYEGVDFLQFNNKNRIFLTKK